MKLTSISYSDKELPLFNINYSKSKNICTYSHIKKGFTGDVYNSFFIIICLFRRAFSFTLVYNQRRVSPVEAKAIHRSKMKLLNRR